MPIVVIFHCSSLSDERLLFLGSNRRETQAAAGHVVNVTSKKNETRMTRDVWSQQPCTAACLPLSTAANQVDREHTAVDDVDDVDDEDDDELHHLDNDVFDRCESWLLDVAKANEAQAAMSHIA